MQAQTQTQLEMQFQNKTILSLVKVALELFVFSMPLSQSAHAQLQIGSSQIEFTYTPNTFSPEQLISVINTSDSTFYFDWEFYMDDSLRMYLRRELHDFNNGYLPHIHTTCGIDRPNELNAHDTGYVVLQYFFYEIPDYIIDSTIDLSFNFLPHPECDSLLAAVKVIIARETTSIRDIDNTDITIYPNPFLDRITIDAPGYKNYEINDCMGIKLKEGIIDETPIDLQGLSAGIYIVILTDAVKKSVQLVAKN
jgi:hypothetical protein